MGNGLGICGYGLGRIALFLLGIMTGALVGLLFMQLYLAILELVRSLTSDEE